MKAFAMFQFVLLALVTAASSGMAQVTRPTSEPPATIGGATGGEAAHVDALRQRLSEAYGRGDVQGLLQYLHPEVVIVFPDGRILRGRQALVDYMDEMLKGPKPVVARYASSPQVDQRYLHGDAVISFGHMNDQYVLTNGAEFGLNSRFTVTAIRVPDGPADTGGWVVRSFHSSTDAFDNPVLHMVARRTAWTAGLGGGLAGLLAGALGMRVIRGGRRAAAPVT